MGLKRNRNYGKMAKKTLRATPMKKTVAKAVAKVKVNNIKSIVRNVLRGDEEVKCVSNLSIANKVLVYGSGLNYALASPNQGWVSLSGVVPNVSVGTSVEGRIGNHINPKRLNVRYSVYANPSTESGSTALPGGNINPYYGLPFRVKVIIFRARYAQDDASQTGIIQAGATAAELTSDIDTFFRPYNKDKYIIKYSKMFKMQNPRHNLTGTAFTQQNQEPNTTSMVIRQVSLKLPKLKFNDSTAVNENQQYYIAFAVCNEDSSVITAGSQSRCTINVESHLYFTDA